MVTGRFSVLKNGDALHALCIINMYKLIKLKENKENIYMHNSIIYALSSVFGKNFDKIVIEKQVE